MTNHKLRVLRIERGIRAIELSMRTGINVAKISHFENRISEPTDAEKLKIAKALGVQPAEIWSERKDGAGNCLAAG